MQRQIKSLANRHPIIKKIYFNFINFGYRSQKRLPWLRVCNSSDMSRLTADFCTQQKKVLMATCTGGHVNAIDMETLLAVSLALRGAAVHALICDGFLPACLMCQTNTCINIRRFSRNGPSHLFCKRCFESGKEAYAGTGVKIHLFSDYITSEDMRQVDQRVGDISCKEIPAHRYRDLAVGEHAMAGALRFFARGDIDAEPYAQAILKRYFKASLLTAIVLQKLQKEQNFGAAVFHHGIYVPHGIIGEVFRKEGVGVVNWNVGYRKGTFIFSHHDTYHHTMMAEPVSNWESIAWNSQLEQEVMAYIKNRSKGTRDWHVFLNEPTSDISTLGIESSRTAVGLLTNVCWDAQLHYPANVFNNMLEWIFKTIDYFIKRPDLQLIIRVHPAEVTAELPSRQLIVTEINKAFPVLPSNIFVIDPASKMNTYTLMEACDAVIIYGTKTGVELTSFGIPVIVAGEAWIRNKGITIDPETQSGYFEVLDALPLNRRMETARIQRARKYAYHFFFRRMVPVEAIRPTDSAYAFRVEVDHLADLMPAENSGLDVICDGILTGKDFIYAYENSIRKPQVV